MATTTKPDGDRRPDKRTLSKFHPNPILLFVLASVLVHGIALVLFALIKRSQPVVLKNANPAPIDFILIPPEESSPAKQSKTTANTLPLGENQPGKVIEPEPKPPTPEQIEAPAPSQTAAVPTETKPPEDSPVKPSQTVAVPTKTKPPEETKADTPTLPEPVAPPTPTNIPALDRTSSEILSGSDTPVEEIETKTPEITRSAKPTADFTEPENTSVATRLPPKITPTKPLETDNSARSNQKLPVTPSTSSAASLLGGSQTRSLEDDGGDSFFKLDNNSSQQAYNPALSNAQSIDMRKYFSEIQRRVRRNWNPKFPMEEYTTVLNFSIQRNGQIMGLKVSQTSGSQKIDLEALKAVQDSAPFAPLPANFPLDGVDIEFNFNIYIY